MTIIFVLSIYITGLFLGAYFTKLAQVIAGYLGVAILFAMALIGVTPMEIGSIICRF